ncbi:MAG TPA: hypothetical protein VF630_09010 [Hymenobacter sp.]|jgi:hypothetical protein
MADLTRYAQSYGELLQTILDWQYVSPEHRFLREPIDELVVGGNTESVFTLGWARRDKLLVMTITYPDPDKPTQQFVHAGGSGGLFTAFANAALYADRRRAENMITFTLTAEQVPRMRALVEEYNEPDDQGEYLDPEERQHEAMFYDEHPELAPDWWDQGPAMSIVEETDLGEGLFSVKLWVQDANTALALGLWWEHRKDGQVKQEGGQADA